MYLIKRNSVYYIRYFDESENRQKQFSTNCKTKTEAHQFLTNFQAELKSKKKLQYISLTDFKNEYLNHIKRQFSAKYHSIVDYTFQSLIKEIGNIPLVKIDQLTLEKFLFDVYDRAKFNASLYYRNLRASFNYAISRNYLESNPLEKFKLPKLPEKINLYISETEFSLIIGKTENQTIKDLFIFAYNTGMRLAEITNLKWSSISLNDGIIKIENTDTFTTKSKRSRIIPINSILFDVLQNRLPKVMDISKDIYVFTKNGVKFNNDFVSKQFKKSVKRANLNNDYHFHLLRGSFITNLAKRNVPLSAIQKLVGHENIRITEKHYLSVQNETLIQAMRTLDVLSKAQNQ